MKRVVSSLVVLLVLSSLVPPRNAEARPMYLAVFRELYLSRLSPVKINCALCHPGRSKRDMNRYGKALEEALGEKNVKDRERVRQAMKSIEHLFPGLPKSDDCAIHTRIVWCFHCSVRRHLLIRRRNRAFELDRVIAEPRFGFRHVTHRERRLDWIIADAAHRKTRHVQQTVRGDKTVAAT